MEDMDLEKAWPKDYNRVKGQDKGKGVSSKAQYGFMQAAASGKVDDISPSEAKEYLENSPKGGEGLPEKGTGGARGERDKKKHHHHHKDDDKKDKAEKKEDDQVEGIKEIYRRPKVVSLEEKIKQIKDKYKEKKPKPFSEQVADIKHKYHASSITKSQDIFYANVEACLCKGTANEELISNMLDMEAYILAGDEASLGELYKTADRYFSAVLSPEEQVVYELSYMAKNGCQESHEALIKFLDEMYDELIKSSTIEDVVSDSIRVSLEKRLKLGPHKDQIEGGIGDKKKPSDFNEKQLQAGVKVEMEHTDDPDIAREIAIDHLTEDPDYYKKLKVMEEGGCDDKAEKSNYGPKGAGLYSEKDNIKRKSRRVGTVHEDVGQNKAEYKYTPAAQGTFADQAKREAKRDQKLSAKNPVKVYTEEEKKKLQEEHASKDKKEASEDDSRVKGKINGESYRMVNGYKRYTSGSKRGTYVHRHEAEKRLGRKLSSTDHVHHKDGNRAGTKNTEVTSRSEHSAETNKKRAKSKNGYTGDHRYEHHGSH